MPCAIGLADWAYNRGQKGKESQEILFEFSEGSLCGETNSNGRLYKH